MCSSILFIHACLGCDATLRAYGLGKGLGLKKLRNPNFNEQAELFDKLKPEQKSEIVKAGEKALVFLYNGQSTEGLDQLRYRRFCAKVASSPVPVEAQSLPPASAAAEYHSLRVYYQIMEWKRESTNLLPENWGWKVLNDNYVPKLTDQKAAPKELLDIIKWECKTDCSTRRCSCKECGLECLNVCHGKTCANSSQPELHLQADDT